MLFYLAISELADEREMGPGIRISCIPSLQVNHPVNG